MTNHKTRVALVRDPSFPDDIHSINLFATEDSNAKEVLVKVEYMISKAVSLTLGQNLQSTLLELQTSLGGRPLNIVIKVNLTQAAVPQAVNTTDPRFAQALCSYLLKQIPEGSTIRVVDNSSYGPTGCTRHAFDVSGIRSAILYAGLPESAIVPLDEESTTLIKCSEYGKDKFLVLEQVRIFDVMLEADYVINVPKLKTQLDELVSLGLKNWQGIIPHDQLNDWGANHTMGQQDSMFQQGHHRSDLSAKIVDLHRLVKSDLVIIDGLWGMEGQGPWEGKPVKMDMVVAGTDVVAVDAIACKCMGIDPDEVIHIRTAHAYGLGTADISNIEVLGESIEDCRKYFKRPSWNPVGYIPLIDVHVGGTCIGCMATVRAFLDTLKRRDKDPVDPFTFENLISTVGEVHIIAGLDVPLPKDLDGVVLVVGDCPFLKSDVIPSYRESVFDRVSKKLKPNSEMHVYKGCNPATAMVECENLLAQKVHPTK